MPNGEDNLSQEAALAVNWNEVSNLKKDVEQLQGDNKREHKDIFDQLTVISNRYENSVPWKVIWVMKVESGIIGILVTIIIGLSAILFKGI